MYLKRLLFLCWLCPFLLAQDPGEEALVPVISSASEPNDDQLAYEQIARFTLAMEQIHDLYLKSGKEVSYDTLIDGAIRGMMANLDDYSQFMNSDTLKSLQETTR